MSGVNAHVVLACPTASSAAVPAGPMLWRRKALGMPVPIPCGHPLLYSAAATEAGNRAVYSMRLEMPCLAFLGDHRVRGAVLLPGVALCEAASAAAGGVLTSSHRRAGVFAASFVAPLCLQPPSGQSDVRREALMEIEGHVGSFKLVSMGAQPKFQPAPPAVDAHTMPTPCSSPVNIQTFALTSEWHTPGRCVDTYWLTCVPNKLSDAVQGLRAGCISAPALASCARLP
jgi:hypothetical protein